jgi:hypothetical protein
VPSPRVRAPVAGVLRVDLGTPQSSTVANGVATVHGNSNSIVIGILRIASVHN